MRASTDLTLIAAILIAIKTLVGASPAPAQRVPPALPVAEKWIVEPQCRPCPEPETDIPNAGPVHRFVRLEPLGPHDFSGLIPTSLTFTGGCP